MFGLLSADRITIDFKLGYFLALYIRRIREKSEMTLMNSDAVLWQLIL